MYLWTWMDSRIRGLHLIDVQLIKLSVAAFILMIAKLWRPLLSLNWYWYALIALVAGIKPVSKVFGKQ
jgi:hypothetical protein